MSATSKGARGSVTKKRKQTDQTTPNNSPDTTHQTPVSARLRSSNSGGNVAPLQPATTPPVTGLASIPEGSSTTTTTPPTGGKGPTRQPLLKPSPDQRSADEASGNLQTQQLLPEQHIDDGKTLLPENFEDSTVAVEEWSTPEERLLERQLELVENKVHAATARAEREAAAHDTLEHLRRVQTELALKKLNAPADPRTQKVPVHLMMTPENCQNVQMVAAHLHRLNSEPEKYRLSFLKQGAGNILITQEQEQMAWPSLVHSVLKNMSHDYLQSLQELIIAPKSHTIMTMPAFLTLKHAASTAVTTYQWLSRIGGSSTTEDPDNMAARMILLSLPEDIRSQARMLLIGRKDKETTISIVTAILENTPDVPATPLPRYGTPHHRTQPFAAPLQEAPPCMTKDIERLVNKAVNERLQILSPAREGTNQDNTWSPQAAGDNAYDNDTCYGCGQTGHRRYQCPHRDPARGKGGKGKGRGKGGKGGKGDYATIPHPPLYATPPPGPPPGPPGTPQAHANTTTAATWPCERCNDGTHHRLSDCPKYTGCELCGSHHHLQRRCPGQQPQPIKN